MTPSASMSGKKSTGSCPPHFARTKYSIAGVGFTGPSGTLGRFARRPCPDIYRFTNFFKIVTSRAGSRPNAGPGGTLAGGHCLARGSPGQTVRVLHRSPPRRRGDPLARRVGLLSARRPLRVRPRAVGRGHLVAACRREAAPCVGGRRARWRTSVGSRHLEAAAPSAPTLAGSAGRLAGRMRRMRMGDPPHPPFGHLRPRRGGEGRGPARGIARVVE